MSYAGLTHSLRRRLALVEQAERESKGMKKVLRAHSGAAASGSAWARKQVAAALYLGQQADTKLMKALKEAVSCARALVEELDR